MCTPELDFAVGSVWKFLEQRALLSREGTAHIKLEPGHGLSGRWAVLAAPPSGEPQRHVLRLLHAL